MSNPIASRDVLCLCVAVLSMVASTTRAESVDKRWSLSGWTPSVSFGMGMLVTSVEGSAQGEEVGVGILDPPGASDGQDNAVTPHFRLGLSLASPEIRPIPGRPSVFATIEYMPMWALDRNIAGVGGADGLTAPAANNFAESNIEGQGSRTRLQSQVSAYGATGGLSFPFRWHGYNFKVKPGVSWIRFAIDVEGVLSRAFKPDVNGRFFRPLVLKSQGKLYMNGIGPSLEVEVDGLAVGPFVSAVFFDASGYKILGDRDINITATQTITDQLGTSTYQGRWTAEVDEWSYRFGVGLRLYLSSD